MQPSDIKISTIRDVYLWFKSALNFTDHAGEITATANEILYRFLNITPDQRVTEPDSAVSAGDIGRLSKAIERLNNHEPVQYITGVTEFDGLSIYTEPGVLIPRQETEELVSWVAGHLKDPANKGVRPGNLLDIGTGTGCIAIALASRLPNYRVMACDISKLSLQVARLNALKNNVSIELLHCDILEKDTPHILSSSLECIVSNPPYVTQADKTRMQPNVLEYEPDEALFVPDNDPLIFYRMIAEKAYDWLSPGSCIFLEINENLSVETGMLLNKRGFTNIEHRRDIHDKNRFIRARKPAQ